MKLAVAGKGGVGKTTISALVASKLAESGARTLAVDCDPNPTLAEEFGLASAQLERFDHSGLRRAGATLELTRRPAVIEVAPCLWILGGPPTQSALVDAVARGIAGVLLAESFDHVITDLGPGPEFTRTAVGGVLNPADLCVVLVDGTVGAARSAAAIEHACAARGVAAVVVENIRGAPSDVADRVRALLEGSDRDATCT